MEVLNKKFDKLYPDKEEESILAVNLESPAMKCLEKLKEHNIFCFPVMNPEHEQRLAGLLDLVDVCSFVVKLWDENPGASSVKFDELFEAALKGRTAADVMNYSKMNECHPLGENATFKDVLKALSQPGVHRVPMLGRGGLLNLRAKRPLARFLTQTDVIRFVATNLDYFGSSLDATILGTVGSYPAYCIPDSTKTIEAFRDMVSKQVTALGVLDEHGKLVGNISVRDIGHVVTSKPGAELNATVKEFLADLRASTNTPRAVVTCGNGDTVRSVITKINSNRIHRVYVLDAAGRPCGLVSLSDICRFLLSIPAKKFPQKPAKNKDTQDKPKKQDTEHLVALVNEALASDEGEDYESAEGKEKEDKEGGN